MLQESEFPICRPDSKHWCVECCTKRGDGYNPCCNLGKLPDGTRGCLGHQTIGSPEELPKLPSSKSFFCLSETLNNHDNVERIRKMILASPPGEFKVSDFLKSLV
jgi:hypothetical protein